MSKKKEKNCPVCTFLIPASALQCSMCFAEIKEMSSSKDLILSGAGDLPDKALSLSSSQPNQSTIIKENLKPLERRQQMPSLEASNDVMSMSDIDLEPPAIEPKTRPPSLPFFNRRKIAEVVSNSRAKRGCSPPPDVEGKKRRTGMEPQPKKQSVRGVKDEAKSFDALTVSPPPMMDWNLGNTTVHAKNCSTGFQQEKSSVDDDCSRNFASIQPDPFNSISLSGFNEQSDNEGEDEKSEIWACGVCTFHNRPGVKQCDICGCPAGSSTKTMIQSAQQSQDMSVQQTRGGPNPISASKPSPKPSPKLSPEQHKESKGKRKVTFMSIAGGPISDRRNRKKSAALPVPFKNVLAHPCNEIFFDKPQNWKRQRRQSMKRKHAHELSKKYKKNKRTVKGKLWKAKLELKGLEAEQKSLIRCKDAAECDYNRNFIIAEEIRKQVEDLQLQLKEKEKVYQEKLSIVQESQKFKAASMLRVEAKSVEMRETQSKIDRLEKMYEDLQTKAGRASDSKRPPLGKDSNSTTRLERPIASGKIQQLNHNRAKNGSKPESNNTKPPRPSVKRPSKKRKKRNKEAKIDMKLDKIRNWVGKSLLKIFGVSSLAQSIEKAIVEACDWDVNKYAPRARDIMFNLRQNHELRDSLLQGSLHASILVSMTNEQLASKKLKAKRSEVKKYNMTAHLLNPYQNEANTSEYKCEKCGSTKCIFKLLQMDRGDEPLEVFVTCIKCQNHWRVDQ